MIAPKIHVSRHPTTRPPERVRAVLVELFQIPFELGFEPIFEVVTILKATRAESDLLLLAHPSSAPADLHVLRRLGIYGTYRTIPGRVSCA